MLAPSQQSDRFAHDRWLAEALPELAGLAPLLPCTIYKAPAVGDKWQQHPGLTVPELQRSRPAAVGWHIRADSPYIAADFDGAGGVQHFRDRGCDPVAADTWRITRPSNPDRLKVVFEATPEQKATLVAGRKKIKVGGDGLELFGAGNAQIVVLGGHYKARKRDDQYTWLGSPTAIAPLPDAWFVLLQDLFCGAATPHLVVVPDDGWFTRRSREEQIELAVSMLRKIPCRGPVGSGTYPTALDAVFALAGHFGPDDALRIIDLAGWHSDHWDVEQKVRDADGSKGIGSLIRLAREYGWSLEAAGGRSTPREAPSAPADELRLGNADCSLLSPHTLLARQVFSRDKGWAAAHGYFYRYAGGVWRRLEDGEIKQAILHCLEQCYTESRGEYNYRFGTARDVKEVHNTLLIRNRHAAIEQPSSLFAFRDCTVDIRTGERLEHDHAHGATVSFNCDWQSDAALPTAAATFFDRCFGSDRHHTLRAVLKMLLDPTMPYGIFIYLVGTTGSGKGLLMKLITLLLPSYRTGSLVGDAAKLERDEGIQQAVIGRQVVFIRDLVDSSSLSAATLATLYSLTDNEPVGIRLLFKDHNPTVKAHVRIVIASTAFPHLRGGRSAEEGWGRRVFYLDTLKREGQPDTRLGEGLFDDQHALGQLACWALTMDRDEAWRILNREVVDQRTQDVYATAAAQSDSVALFLDRYCRPNGNQLVDLAAVGQVYRWWCSRAGHQPFAVPGFIANVRAKLPHLHQPRRRKPGCHQTRLPAEDRGLGVSAEICSAWVAAAPPHEVRSCSGFVVADRPGEEAEGWLERLQGHIVYFPEPE